MFLRLPKSTLFPYTTLFRSISLRVRKHAPHRGRVGRVNRDRPARVPLVMRALLGQKVSFERLGALDRSARAEDRKSTRLNSSHQIISYAVFSLKKKIIIIFL